VEQTVAEQTVVAEACTAAVAVAGREQNTVVAFPVAGERTDPVEHTADHTADRTVGADHTEADTVAERIGAGRSLWGERCRLCSS